MITFRKAKMHDVENLHLLINDFAEKGFMLPRSRNTLYEALREFTIIENDGEFAGAGALHIIWEDLAEVRALAIKPEYQGQGVGFRLIDELLKEAQSLGIHQVFALTYRVDFFKKCGFTEVTKEEMPHKVWKECINCPKFPNCDEVAVIRHLP
jgi:amino-acid N-acetyltransferase